MIEEGGRGKQASFWFYLADLQRGRKQASNLNYLSPVDIRPGVSSYTGYWVQ